jgi:hypothetical protein
MQQVPPAPQQQQVQQPPQQQQQQQQLGPADAAGPWWPPDSIAIPVTAYRQTRVSSRYLLAALLAGCPRGGMLGGGFCHMHTHLLTTRMALYKGFCKAFMRVLSGFDQG